MHQIGVDGAVVGRDGSAVEDQGVGGDADSVLITVLFVHVVGEVQGLAVQSGEGRVPRLRSDGQRHLRPAGCRHRDVELDCDLDDLPELVGVAPRRGGDDGDRGDCGRLAYGLSKRCCGRERQQGCERQQEEKTVQVASAPSLAHAGCYRDPSLADILDGEGTLSQRLICTMSAVSGSAMASSRYT